MKVTEFTPVLEAHIGELETFLRQGEDSWRIGDLARRLSLEVAGEDYIIPAADTGGDLNFNNLEVLRRFSLTSCEHQRIFLVALRRVMVNHEVEEARITVGWSRNKTKVLTVKSFGGGKHLKISV